MPISLREQIGERITALREARGLSQKDLSDELAKIGLTVRRETVTQWENGTRDLKTEYLAKISEFFGVSADWLLGLTDAPERTPAAVDELGLSMNAVDRLLSLHNVSKVPPERNRYSRCALLSDLLEDEEFTGWFLANCTQYVERIHHTASEEFVLTPEYTAISSELKKHGFEIATSEAIAERIFSGNIIPRLRNMLDRLAKKRATLDPAHEPGVVNEEGETSSSPEAD